MKNFVILFVAITEVALADCLPHGETQAEPEWFAEVARSLAILAQQTEGQPGRGPDLTAVYGRETRVLVEKAVHPWPAIGRITTPGSGFCTATLVGECVILTAAHCVSFDKNGFFLPVSFTPRFGTKSYEVADGGFIPKGWAKPTKERDTWENSEENFHKDWALIKVLGRPGKKYGYVGMRWGWGGDNKRAQSEIKKFYVAGHSLDFEGAKLSVDEDAKDISIAATNVGRVFTYKADAAQGASGGPILDQDFMIIGIHTRGAVNEDAVPLLLPENTIKRSVGVPADYFAEELLKLKAQPCDD